MTISSQTRTAGPFSGTGLIVAYPFTFKVFQTSDVVAAKVDSSGTQTTLALGTDYTVSLNTDQNTAPGGSVTLLVALPVGYTLTLTSSLSITQPASLTNAGGFFPQTIENALDRLTILMQQQGFITSVQALRVPEYAGVPVLPATASRAGNLLGFDASGNPIAVAPVSGSAASLAADIANSASATKGAGQVGFNTGNAYAAGTVGADLNAVRPVLRGGTGASTVAGALANLGVIDINATVTVTGATVLTGTALGKCILVADSGSPANYQVTLPAGAATGSMILVRISKGATKLFTIHGNDAVIDGSTTRIMWAGESALLVREASNWAKLSGVSKPLMGGITRTANQTGIVVSAMTQVSFTSAFGDPSGFNFTYGGTNLSIVRPGNYNISGNLSIAGTSIATYGALIALVQNAGTPSIAPNATVNAIVGAGASRFCGGVSGLFNCALGDGIGLIGQIGGGTSLIFEYQAALVAPTLTYQEVPQW